MKARYSYIIALNDAENEEVVLLRKQGKKIVDIFRDGLRVNLKEVPKGLIKKAKDLV